jgi:RNA-directed DNA polymerase
VFEGDFKGCFDNLNHDYILEQINGFPARNVIAKWLKAGYVDNNVFHESEDGTPQGGIISPLLLISMVSIVYFA